MKRTAIEKEQARVNIAYEAAKKMAETLETAKADFKKNGGDEEGWSAELETIQRLVFEDE